MNKCLDRYINTANFSDRLLADIFSCMCTFARKNNLQIEHEQSIRRSLNQKNAVLHMLQLNITLTSYLYMNN